MQRILLTPHAVVLNEERVEGAKILIHDGRVEAVGDVADANAESVCIDGTVLPGFVDVQVNGMGGHGCEEPSFEALDTVSLTAARGGAAAFLPTLITASMDDLVARTSFLADWIDRGAPGSTPVGIHLEGPFLESSGAHDDSLFVDPTPERVDALLEAGRGHVRLVTLACGRDHAAEATRLLTERGVTVSVGHAHSTRGFGACVDAGASMVTHLFNAMSPLHHRDPGVVGLALDDARIRCGIILDGHHVAPSVARVAWRAIGSERTVLVTDAMNAAGMPDGRYELSGIPVELRDGVVRDAEGRLAGSALTMHDAAAFFLEHVSDSPDDLAMAAATAPARALGLDDWGRIAPGTKADFTILDGRQLRSWTPPQ